MPHALRCCSSELGEYTSNTGNTATDADHEEEYIMSNKGLKVEITI